MPYSTNSRLASTWPIEDVTLTLVQGVLACDATEAKRLRSELAQLHRDPSWLDATVARLPVPALCIAATLAGRGGLLRMTELEQLVKAKFELTRTEIDAGVHALMRELLVAPLASATSELLALVASAADGLADRVAELDLVVVEGEFTPARANDSGRTLVGVISALAGAELAVTRSGGLHRTGTKKLAKQLGLGPQVIEAHVFAALDAGLLEISDSDVLSINRDALLAALEGRYPQLTALEQLRMALERYGSLSHPAVDTFMTNASRRGVATLPPERIPMLPGFCAGTVGTAPVLRFVAPVGSSAASVTPSFEVILPPESRLRDLVRVLEVCEVTRIDRAIVARITKASITRATSRSLTANEIIEGLTLACRTAVPQNVTAAIHDWAASTVSATIASGTVIAVPPADEARVRVAFAAAHPVSIAPGVFVLRETTERAAAQTLRKLGILDRTPVPARVPKKAVEEAALPRLGLQSRLVAYRRGEPSEPRLVPVEKIRPPLKTSAGSAPSATLLEHDTTAVHERLERWESQHATTLPLDVFDALLDVLVQLPLQDRTFMFGARSEDELIGRLMSLLTRPSTRAAIESEYIDLLSDALGRELQPKEDDLQWDREHVLERLEAAARVHGKLVIDRRNADRRTIAVSKISYRGSMLMVLGEDDEHVSHAIRVVDIVAVADPSTARTSSAKWQPAPGMPVPAGHVRCPCGSGKRYRECCRVPD